MSATCVNSVLNMAIDCILVTTKTSELPRLLSKYRPRVPILVCSTDDVVLKNLTVTRGVIPFKIDVSLEELTRPQSAKSFRRELAKIAINAAKEKGLTKCGGKVLYV